MTSSTFSFLICEGYKNLFCYVILYVFSLLSLPPLSSTFPISFFTLSITSLFLYPPFTPTFLYTFSPHPFYTSLSTPPLRLLSSTPPHIYTSFHSRFLLYSLSTLYSSLYPLLSTRPPLSSFLDLVRDSYFFQFTFAEPEGISLLA